MSVVYIHEWRFWGQPHDRSNFTQEWRESLTPRELIPDRLRDADGLTVHVNGRRLPGDEWETFDLSPGDHLDYGVRPAGLEGVTAALVSAAVSASVSFVISLILPKPKGPKRRGDDESPTYAWDGKDNTRVEGQPRAPIYGELRTAPQIIDQFVRTQNVPPRSDLYVLMSLGEGPIHSIGGVTSDNPIDRPLSSGDPSYPLPKGIEINGNPLENFRGVEAHVRLGTNEQVGIPGFEEIHTVSEVGSTLNQQETSASTNAGTAWSLTTFPFNSNDAGVQQIWSDYNQAFDLPAAADAYTITVDFPEGLYRIDTSGNLQDAYFQALVRYRELDALGDPITTGGDNGDGWVYAAPTPRLVARHQSSFPYEIGGRLYSSAAYTPAVQGRVLAFDATGLYAQTSLTNGGAASNAVTPWTAGQSIPEFTWEGWYKPASLPLTGAGGSNTVRPIFEWMSTGTFRGISILLRRVTVDVGSDVAQERWRLQVYFGNETATLREFNDGTAPNPSSTQNFPAVRWYHIAVTYKVNASGTTDRWRIYIDGVLVFTFNTLHELVAAAAPFLFGRTTATPNGTVSGFGRLDEVRVWAKELTAAQVQDSFALGIGTFGMAGTGLVAGWHFDLQDNVNNFTFASSYADANNKVTTVGGASVGDPSTQTDAVVFRLGSGQAKRARYRIQVMRFNLKSTSSAIGDRSDWKSVDGRIDLALAYPNTPLLALKIPATDQLNTTTPTITVVSKGRVLEVWDGLSAVTPSFTQTWSANPAWVAYDVLTNRRYGRGGDFDASKVDLVSLKEWADYCDEKIYDGLGRTAIHESDSAAPIQKVFYDSTLNGGTGGIELYFRLGVNVPAQWKEGGYLGLAGLPVPPTATIVVDINVPNIPAMQITSIYFNGGVWVVRLAYDTATYGHPWADASFMDFVTTTTVAGTAEGREERFRFDGVFDTFQKVWDVLLQIGGSARAMPVLDGSRVRFRVAKPRDTVGIIGKGQIEPGSFKVEYSGRLQRPNLYVTDFLDRDQNWKLKPAERADPTLTPGAQEGAINRDNIEMVGVVRRSQVLRDMDFRLAVNRTLTKQVEFVTGIEGLLHEVGDVVTLSHDLVPWGISGRIPIRGAGTTTIVIDRSNVVLDPGKTYYLRVRVNRVGQVGTGSGTSDYHETRLVTGLGAATPSTVEVEIASPFTVEPYEDDPYVLFATDEEQLIELAEVTTLPDLRRKVRGIAYDGSIFDVDTLPQDIPAELQLVMVGAPPSPSLAPAAAMGLTAREAQRLGADGQWAPEVLASWRLPNSEEAPAEAVVWARVAGDESAPWEVVTRAPASATSARFRAPVDEPGSEIELAVQLVGSRGTRLDPSRGARARLRVDGAGVAPPAPTNLSATIDGDRVTYSWTPPADPRGLVYELRRGGWALGQTIGVAPAGSSSFGPTRNWANSKDNARGDGPPPIVLRARDARGQYSEAVVLSGFSPRISDSEVLTGDFLPYKAMSGDTRWEDYDPDGWLPASVTPNDPDAVDLEVATDPEGRRVLQFTGSALSGTYTTAPSPAGVRQRPQRVFVEAFATAVQIPPITLEQMTLPVDDPRAARRSLEGRTDRSACTLTIEWRFKESTGASHGPWQPFTPGEYFIADPQFRLVATRPDASWDVAIQSFGTRVSLERSWAPVGGPGDFAKAGTSTFEAWYIANCVSNVAMNTGTVVANRAYAMPFVAPRRGGTLDRLAISVTTGASGNCRLGIYATDSNAGLYPGPLLLDAGVVSTTSIAVVSRTISQALQPGELYWIVAVFDATPVIRTMTVNQAGSILGTSSALGANGNCGIYASLTYGALPSTFPGSPTMITGAPIPALAYRFSA